MNMLKLSKLSLLFLFPFFLHAADGGNIKHIKEKTIKKTFQVNRNATLEIDNSYGNLNIITWSENRIVIEVHITTTGPDADQVQRKLDAISVSFSSSPDLVSAETIFGDTSSSWWQGLFQNNSTSMEINYLVKMPITNNVDLDNDYGNINLDQLEGRAIISCDYGKIITKGLMAANNSLNFDYSDNCYFEYIKSGKINADYSGFKVGKTKTLVVSADYTDSTIEVAEEVIFECDYGKMKIGMANNVQGNGDYLTMQFGKIYKNITLESNYGAISIAELMDTAGDVSIDADYTGIEIGIQPGYHFDFRVDLEYASFQAPDSFEFIQKSQDSGDKYFEGFYGNPGSGNSINIGSDYGSVRFYLK